MSFSVSIRRGRSMDSVLQCLTCGANGDSNFSTNDLGESVCNLCGTQNFQQSRNESQELDDIIGTNNKPVFTRVIRKKKESKDNKRKRKRDPTTLENSLHVCQRILHIQAQELGRLVQDPSIPNVVQDLWFHLLKMWETNASRPLLNIFLDYSRTERKYIEDSDYETDWDLSIKMDPNVKVFSTFNYRHFLSLLYLACRIRQLGVLTSDIFHWVQSGVLPFTNLLEQLPLELQECIQPVRLFFSGRRNHSILSASVIAEQSIYLQYHLDLKLPAFNHGIAIANITSALRFPPIVRAQAIRFTAIFPCSPSEIIESLSVLQKHIECEMDIAGAIIVAVKMTPQWNVWEYESTEDVLEFFPSKGDFKRAIKRKLVPSFADMCKRNLSAKTDLPSEFHSHLGDLKRIGNAKANVGSTYEANTVTSMVPLYQDGIATMPPETFASNTYFYPIYSENSNAKGACPATLEQLFDVVAKYMDIPPGTVRESAYKLERKISKKFHF